MDKKLMKDKVLTLFIVKLIGLLMSGHVVAATYTQGKLENGLKYHIFATQQQKDYLDLHLMINVGGADESADEFGSAHMLEHTLFHKSKHFSKGISTELAMQGWKLGEQLNAYTGYQQTKFVMTPPLGVKELDTALLALQDIIAAPGLTEQDWAREQQIVLAERRNNLGLRQRMSEARRQVLYRHSKQAQSTLIGTEQDIVNRKVATLRAFHQRWYQPENMQIAIIGDVDPAQIEAKLSASLGVIAGKKVPKRADNYYDPKLSKGWFISKVSDPESKVNQVSLIFRNNDGLPRDHISQAGIRNQQIDRSARTVIMERIDAYNLTLPDGVEPLFIQRTDVGNNTAAITLFAGSKSDKQQLALEQLFAFRQQLLNFPITEAELNFYRDDMDSYIKANLDATELPEAVPDLTRLALGALRDRPVTTLANKVKTYQQVMQDISAQDVNKRIQDWMMADDKAAMFQMNSSTGYKVPTQTQLQQLVLAFANTPIPVPKDIEELVGGNFEFALAKGKVINKSKDAYYEQIQHWTLSNGDSLVWLKNGIAKDDILLRSVANVGYLAKPFEGWKARLASQFVWMSAPQGYDMQSLGTWRRRNSIIFRNTLGPRFFQINAETGEENIEKVLQAYAAYHVTPQIDDNFMQAQLAGIRTSLINQRDQNQRIKNAEEALRYQVSHLTVPELSKLDDINKAELLHIWQDIVEAPVTHFLVSDLPEQQIETLVNQYLAGLPRKQQHYHFHQEQLASGEKTVQLTEKNHERTDIDAWSWLPYQWSIQSNQQLTLATRLAQNALKEALRGKEKGVYSVDFNTRIDLDSHQLVSHMYFNSQPEKADKLWQVSQTVLHQLAENLTPKMLNAEKKHLLRNEQRALKKAQIWLARMSLSYQQHGDARVLKEMYEIDKNTSFEQTQSMLKHIWAKDNLRSLWVSPQGN